MSRTTKHTLNGKFNNKLIEVKDMPMSMLHYWNRMNFLTGHYRSKRKEYFQNIKLQELKEIS